MAESTQLESPVSQLAEGVPVVEFRNVSIGFDGNQVLRDISFRVERGETLVLLGPAGCGKSLVLKLANGLLAPDSGEICIFGQSLNTMTQAGVYAMREHVGMVFQESALFDSMNVESNVAYRLIEEGVAEEETHNRVVEALRFVELEKAITKFPSELSGGMRRRVSIARAIISNPDLILYDSPTGGLDPITSNTIIELVVKQRDVSHTTSLVITHRLQDAFTLATHRYDESSGHMQKIPDGGIEASTKFLVMREGHVVFDGTTQQLVHSDDPWIRDYLA